MKKILGALMSMLCIALSCVTAKAETANCAMEIIPSETVEMSAEISVDRKTIVIVIIDGDDVIIIVEEIRN